MILTVLLFFSVQMMKMDPISRPIPLQIPTLAPQPSSTFQPQTPPSRSSYTEALLSSDESSPSPPSPPPPPPPMASVAHQTAPPCSYVKYSTLARLQNQNQFKMQQAGGVGPHSLPMQPCAQPNYNTLPATYAPSPPSPPPPPPPEAPAPSSAMAALKFRTPSPAALLPPPPPEEETRESSYLLPPPPESLDTNGLPPPPLPQPLTNPCLPLSNEGLQQFLAQKFPNMEYDFSLAVNEENSPPPPPPPTELSLPISQVLRPLSPNAPPPAPPKTFTGGFPPQTAPKRSGPSSLPIMSPVSPTQPPAGHGPVKKQQSFSTGHSPNQPPPTLPKQHSLSSKNLAISPSSSSSSVSIAAATSSLVKQIVNQFPGNASNPSAPQSPPAVKAKPKWQLGGAAAPQSPEFPPPPPDSSLGDFPPPPTSSSSKIGSPIKKSPSTSSTGSTGSTKRGPPPTPQRASSMRDGQEERPKKVESLLSKFGQAPQTGTSSSSSSATGSPSKDSSSLPAPLPKPGKLNLANLPLALQGLQTTQHHPSDFPSPPPPPPPSQPTHPEPLYDYFPPPPSESELFPPPLHPSEFHHPPKVAVVNPQPQMQPPSQTSSLSLSWKQGSLKKGAVPPPTLSRRSSNTAQYDNTISLPLSPPLLSQSPPPSLSSYSSSPVPPTSPKSAGPGSLALKPHFLEDLNRTLKRKSVSRHSSLISSSKLEPVGTMDDMALLPPPPPELLAQQQGVRGHAHTLSRHHTRSHSTKHSNISGYATLRRGPPPAPPKRDQSTKLTGEW